jgi:hypothetical protein
MKAAKVAPSWLQEKLLRKRSSRSLQGLLRSAKIQTASYSSSVYMPSFYVSTRTASAVLEN